MKRLFCCLLALALLLCGCAAVPAASAPSPTPDASDAPDAPEPLYVLYSGDTWDGVALRGGEVLARGNVGGVSDASTGLLTGYCVSTLDTSGGQPVYFYKLYRPDGTLWLDCGAQAPGLTLGRWVSLSQGNVYNSFESTDCFIDPDTGEIRFAEDYYPAGAAAPGQYLLVSNRYEDPPPPLLVDEELNVLTEFTGWNYAYVSVHHPYLLLNHSYEDETGYHYESTVYDPATGRYLDYANVHELPGGYCAMQYPSDDPNAPLRYDILTPDGEVVVRDTTDRYIFYSPVLQAVEGQSWSEVTLHGRLEGQTCRSAGFMGDRIYVLLQSGELVWLDADGNELGRTMTHPDARVSDGDDLILITWSDTAQLWSAQGLLWERELGEDELFNFSPLYSTVGADGGARYRLYHFFNGFSSTALLNERGEVLLDKLALLYTTSVPGVYQVRKGFDRGLMNENGEWLWRESIFADATDEIDDPMW